MAYINDQKARAAQIEASGRAEEVMSNKYRGLAYSKQPTPQEKAQERAALTQDFLCKMSPEERIALGNAVEKNALKEKKGGYFPPETSIIKIKGYLVALVETIAIAIWGTLLALVCAIPASFFAAKNTLALIISADDLRSRSLRTSITFGVRRFLDSCRGFNEFVMALIFVAVIGLGPYAGILALWIHTFGVLGKVFSEQIEAIESGQVEALTSTGANPVQTIVFSVMPQVLPGLVSYTLLRFESNVRSAAILGFVGAGGIGFLIFDKLNGYLFREVCTMMIIIIMTVGIIDHFCGKIRMKFI
jgi:phosphonate transport system permease protein